MILFKSEREVDLINQHVTESQHPVEKKLCATSYLSIVQQTKSSLITPRPRAKHATGDISDQSYDHGMKKRILRRASRVTEVDDYGHFHWKPSPLA